MATINNPMTTTKVANTLGLSSRDVGTLCSSDRINPFARYKPVAYPSVAPDRDGTWYRAADGSCGVAIGHAFAGQPSQAYDVIIQQYKDGAWTYVPPKGGAEEPFRLADFDGYDHNAVPFFYSEKGQGYEYTVDLSVTNTLTIQGRYNTSASLSGSSLTIEDFQTLGEGLQDAHLGVFLFDGDPLEAGSSFVSATYSDESIRNNGSVTLTFSQSQLGHNLWIVLYLQSVTVSNSMCIPYNKDNYFMFKVNVTQELPFEAVITSMHKVGGTSHNMSYWTNNPFPSDNGSAIVILQVQVKNNTDDTDYTFGSSASNNYNLRTQFDGRYYSDAMYICDVNGTQISISETVPRGQTRTYYLRAGNIFQEFVDSFGNNTTELSASLYLQAQSNIIGQTHVYQVADGPYRLTIQK